jgi:hypothetical protein
MQAVTANDFFRKEFGVLDDHLVHPFPIGTVIAHDFLVLFHGQRQRNPLMGNDNIGFGFGTISLRHGGWSRDGVSAYHASKPQIPTESGNFL